MKSNNQKTLTITKKIILFLSILLTLTACAVSEPKQSIEQDLIKFCEIYSKNNWQNIKGMHSIIELETYVNNVAKNSVKDPELKAIIDEMLQMELYRQVYPHVKERVEELYQTEWHCPQLQAFYTPTITKSPEQNELSLDVKLNKNGEFFISGEKLDLSDENINTLKPYFTVNDKMVNSVHISIQENTSQALLQPLLKILPLLGIHNVTLETN